MAFSSAVTLVITVSQLYRDYEHDLAGVHGAFEEIDIVHLPSLNQELWAQNFEALRIQLDGILAMSQVDRVVLQERKGRRIEVGAPPSSRMIEHTVALTYRYRGKLLQLGTLRVWSSTRRIWNRLFHETLAILIGNGIKTFLVSGFVLLIFYRLIGRHLLYLVTSLNALSPDGRGFPLQLRRRAHPDKRDELDLVVRSINAMGERLSSTIAQLKESEARLTFLMDHSTEGIIIHDGKSIVNLSSGACALLGGTLSDFIGMDPLLTIAPEYRAEAAARIHRGEESEFELENLRLDGSHFPAHVRSRYSLYQGRRVRVVAFHDISERRAMEARLREAQKLEAVGILAGGIAHDFNNMLQVIAGYTALARANASDEGAVQAHLEQVSRAAERASGVTRQLLAFSRHEPIRTKALDVPALVDAQARMLRPLLGERVRLEVDAPRDCPAVSADAGLIEQVLVNLCINARDAMPKGGRIRIGIRDVRLNEDRRPTKPGQPGAPFVEIAVADTGTGISPEVRPHLFEPFFTTKERGKGTGLGLSTAYGIVLEHGGTIDVESEPGEGAVFRVYLPVADTPAALPAAPAPAPRSLEGTETILVADDQSDVRTLMCAFLQDRGYRTVAVANGRAAVEAVSAEPARFDLVLLDINMPELNGREAYAQIQRIRRDVPAVFCTGHVDSTVRQAFPQDPDAPLLRKPFLEQELLVAVRTALDRRPAAPATHPDATDPPEA